MSAEPSSFLPHNTLWRKLRRRYFFDRFSLFGAVFAYPAALCSVSWLLHGPLWLTLCFGTLWFLASLFMTLAMAMSLTSGVRRGVQQLRPLSIRLTLFWSLFVNGATVIVLLMGRIDWAFYIVFGLSVLSGLGSGRTISFQTALQLVLGLALCLAFALHAVWMVVALLLLQFLRPWRFRPELREAIRQKPTRAEYVARSREACEAGGG